jgi:hypothetical protein
MQDSGGGYRRRCAVRCTAALFMLGLLTTSSTTTGSCSTCALRHVYREATVVGLTLAVATAAGYVSNTMLARATPR